MNGNGGGSSFSRRDWLKLAGAAAVTAAAAPAQAHHLATKAKKNFKLGIFTNVYRQLPLEDAVRRIKEQGFQCLATDFNFADVRFDPFQPDWEAIKKVRDCLDRNGLRISALYGYYNVVHPDPEKRRKGRQRMEFLISNWKRLGCPNVSTETGTFNAKSEWAEDPRNVSEEGYLEFRREITGLAALAEKAGAQVSLEAYWRNIIGSIDRAQRVLKEVNSPALKLVMDPCNYFRIDQMSQIKPMLEEMFRRLGRYALLAHAKDVVMSAKGQEHPAAGRGVLDYPLFFRLLAELDRPIDVLLEHLTLDDVPRALGFVRKTMENLP